MTLNTPQPRDSQIPDFRVLSEPELAFDPIDASKCDRHPLRGLITNSPFTARSLASYLPVIRIGTISPCGESGVLAKLVGEMRRRHSPRERREYLVDYPGFKEVFGTEIELAGREAHVELPADLNDRIERSNHPERVLADVLADAIGQLSSSQNAFDVVMVYIPIRWERGFYGGVGDDFDLHDFFKATAAHANIASQWVREDRALAYPDRCSVAWRMGIAIYTKAGGIPWKLRDSDAGVAYIGLSYAMRSQPSSQRFVTCCSQVFDAEGTGLEFLTYPADSSRVRMEGKNPFLDREQMRAVMTRSLALYQRRHSGRVPERIVVHKTTRFTPFEVEGCFDAWGAVSDVELLQIQQDTSWRGIRIVAPRPPATRGEPDGYPVHRGSIVHLGENEVLLWTQGNAPSIMERGSYFKEKKGIPHPLLIRRWAGHSEAQVFCREILGLTKMNWNNDGLYDRLPTTLHYAAVLADIVKRMPGLDPSRSYPFRLFM
jgi:hypothetical protein